MLNVYLSASVFKLSRKLCENEHSWTSTMLSSVKICLISNDRCRWQGWRTIPSVLPATCHCSMVSIILLSAIFLIPALLVDKHVAFMNFDSYNNISENTLDKWKGNFELSPIGYHGGSMLDNLMRLSNTASEAPILSSEELGSNPNEKELLAKQSKTCQYLRQIIYFTANIQRESLSQCSGSFSTFTCYVTIYICDTCQC